MPSIRWPPGRPLYPTSPRRLLLAVLTSACRFFGFAIWMSHCLVVTSSQSGSVSPSEGWSSDLQGPLSPWGGLLRGTVPARRGVNTRHQPPETAPRPSTRLKASALFLKAGVATSVPLRPLSSDSDTRLKAGEGGGRRQGTAPAGWESRPHN